MAVCVGGDACKAAPMFDRLLPVLPAEFASGDVAFSAHASVSNDMIIFSVGPLAEAWCGAPFVEDAEHPVERLDAKDSQQDVIRVPAM